MFCENCGKQLIRGYAFCHECGSPVPPEVLEEGGLPGRGGDNSEGSSNQAEQTANDASDGIHEINADVQASMPGIEPIGKNDNEGTLVLCPNCGMRMQKRMDICEKCGMKLNDKATNSVPLINNNPMNLDGSFNGFESGVSGFSDSDINQINNFMNGGMPSTYDDQSSSNDMFGTESYSQNDIDSLAQQITNFGVSANQMPEISKIKPPVRQKEPDKGKEREVEDFSMTGGNDEFMPMSDGAVPIIEGCSMDENPDADISLDPYSFLGNSMDDNPSAEIISPKVEPAAVEEIAPEVEPAAFEEIAPAVEEIVPQVEPATVEDIAPAVEDIVPQVEPAAFEEIAPAVEEIVPQVEPATVEDIAPAVDDIVPQVEPAAFEDIAPAVDDIVPQVEPAAVEEIAPAVEEIVPQVEPVAVAEPVNIDNPIEASEPVSLEEPDFIPEEMGFIAESSPFTEETTEPANAVSGVKTESKPIDDLDFRRPSKPQAASGKETEEEVHDGNLVYCRNCGQDMYDTEQFCKNCGAPYKGAYVPPKTAPSKNGNKETPKVFGKIPLPKFMGVVAAVIGVAAAVLFLVQPWRVKDGDLTGEKTQTSTSSNSSAESNSSEGQSNSSEEQNNSSSESTSSASSSDSQSSASSNESGSSSDSSSASSSSSKSDSSSSKSSSSSSTTPVIIGGMSAKVKSLEQDREKMMDAAAQMAGEIGKMEAFSQHVIYAMDTSSSSAESARKAFYSTTFAKNMLSNLSAGKSAVDKAVSAASPANSEYRSIYNSLKSLKTKYESYYSFIKSPSGSYSGFTTTCSSYTSNFNSGLSNLNLSTFITSSYTVGNKNSAYASAVSEAVTAIRNSTSKLSTLQSKISGLGSNFDSKVYSTLSDSMSSFAGAASYAYRVKAYAIMLRGVSSGYSGALTYINSADSSLQHFIETYSYIKENSLSSYKAESSTAIYNANSYANSASAIIGR